MTGGLVVMAGPSGVGKSTLQKRLMDNHKCFSFAISCTTRAPRPTEEHGREYYFVDDAQFDRQVAEGGFAEWEAFFERRYGTLKSEIERLRRAGQHVLFDVDVKGALNLRALYPEARLVFVAPPSLEALGERLRRRGTESEEQVRVRLARAAEELALAPRFDHVVVNDELEQSYHDLLRCLRDLLRPADDPEEFHAKPA